MTDLPALKGKRLISLPVSMFRLVSRKLYNSFVNISTTIVKVSNCFKNVIRIATKYIAFQSLVYIARYWMLYKCAHVHMWVPWRAESRKQRRGVMLKLKWNVLFSSCFTKTIQLLFDTDTKLRSCATEFIYYLLYMRHTILDKIRYVYCICICVCVYYKGSEWFAETFAAGMLMRCCSSIFKRKYVFF